ncbi:MAG: DEAD/DEAH box helicase [Kiritimatiellae bacterium]|nr:DEAD/DEAH box helicase [Kiritimatiellia bacterium]
MTASGAHRPGGAVSEDEVAKRREEHQNWSLDQFVSEPVDGKLRFHDLDLPLEVMHGVADLGFSYCTPIQALSLEHALAGKNIAGRAQTGTGKTAAFLVAILTRYLRSPEARQEKGGAPRALVIAPTRELVIQICKDAVAVGKYCGLRSLAVYGGMDYDRQKREVTDAPVDLLVATPGRLLDFVRSRVIDLSKVDTLVIDEADRMLDMGFIPDVRSIINRLPPKDKRCTMLYSATLSDDVMRLASQWMESPVKVEIESESVTTKSVRQIVYVVTADEKFTVLYNHIQQYPDSRMLIFCNRRSTTEDVADSLTRRGIRCEMLSGDVNQNRRLRVLEDFREGSVRIVVATDVAGRGLHVDDIGFVVNFDFPYEPEDYVHRIGRTGRAGASGTAISFADEDESFIIPEIEKYIGEELKCTVLQKEDPLLVKLPPRRAEHTRGMPQPLRDGQQVQEQQQRKGGEAQGYARGHERTSGGAAVAKQEPVAVVTVKAPEAEAVKVNEEPAKKEPEPVRRPEPSGRNRPHGHRPSRMVKPRHETVPHIPAPVIRPGGLGRPPRYSEDWVPGQGE